MTRDEERERFEAYAGAHGYFLGECSDEGATYFEDSTERAWHMWQASRAAACRCGPQQDCEVCLPPEQAAACEPLCMWFPHDGSDECSAPAEVGLCRKHYDETVREAKLEAAACERCAEWQDRMRAIVGEDQPDSAGNAVLALKAQLERAPAATQRTHHADCYDQRGHHDCAIAEVERLRAQLERAPAGLVEAAQHLLDICTPAWVGTYGPSILNEPLERLRRAAGVEP